MKMQRACLGLVLVVTVLGAALGHTVLDPDLARTLLTEIARYQKQSGPDRGREAQAEAAFEFGARVQTLVGLLNQDLGAHGMSDPVAQEVVTRLGDAGIKVLWSDQRRTYSYDMQAFRDYQRLAPDGPHAAESRYRLISAAFYSTLEQDPSKVAAADIPAVVGAIVDERHFLKDYPGDARAREVCFYLGIDCYRLSRNVRDPGQIRDYRRCAQEALQIVATQYRGSIEARAAEALLESGDSSALR